MNFGQLTIGFFGVALLFCANAGAELGSLKNAAAQVPVRAEWAKSCANDIKTHCADKKDNERLKCLIDFKDKVSNECRSAISNRMPASK